MGGDGKEGAFCLLGSPFSQCAPGARVLKIIAEIDDARGCVFHDRVIELNSSHRLSVYRFFSPLFWAFLLFLHKN